MNSSSTRRSFLTTASLAFAGLGLGAGVAHALPIDVLSLLADKTGRARPIGAHLPDGLDPAFLRMLATTAVDAARQAGAQYADIRIADRRALNMILNGSTPSGGLQYRYSYGIRARVGGAWSFAAGLTMTPDAVARIARQATSTAAGCAPMAGSADGFASLPAATGEWRTPVTIDPFAISLDEHAYALGDLNAAGQRVMGVGVIASAYWISETRVFASSEGRSFTNFFTLCVPAVRASVSVNETVLASLGVDGFAPTWGGFETLTRPELPTRIERTADEVARIAALSAGALDVGRFRVVLDGASVGTLVGATLAPALELDRVLGYYADGAGTSFLAPPQEVLGTQPFSPHLSLIAGRRGAAPMRGAWDDEGVPAAEFPLIRDGRIVDYCGTRASLAGLRALYPSGASTQGSAFAPQVDRPPVGYAEHVTVPTSASAVGVEDLARDMGNGLLLRDVNDVASDQQLTGGLLRSGTFLEVRGGRVVRRLPTTGLQFRSRVFWKNIVALGGTSTMSTVSRTLVTGPPWAWTWQTIAAPAAHISEIDVVRLGGRV